MLLLFFVTMSLYCHAVTTLLFCYHHAVTVLSLLLNRPVLPTCCYNAITMLLLVYCHAVIL